MERNRASGQHGKRPEISEHVVRKPRGLRGALFRPSRVAHGPEDHGPALGRFVLQPRGALPEEPEEAAAHVPRNAPQPSLELIPHSLPAEASCGVGTLRYEVQSPILLFEISTHFPGWPMLEENDAAREGTARFAAGKCGLLAEGTPPEKQN